MRLEKGEDDEENGWGGVGSKDDSQIVPAMLMCVYVFVYV